MRSIINYAVIILMFICISCKEKNKITVENQMDKVKLMTLDPGHFHAALVQKTMYPQVDSTIHIYAPEGLEVNDFLDKIEQYNKRESNPTAWNVKKYLGTDYLDKMIAEKPGNVMVVAGKNSKKIDYILEAVKAGLNVYADKPLVINPEGFEKLKQAFKIADKNNVIIYDIMTERFESTTLMQKQFSLLPEIFGELVEGTMQEPAISKESVHHFFKNVSGKPLVRPSWFFDINEEGEGIVDVTTHLVDLIQWEAFPNQIIDSSQIDIISARRWPTLLNLDEFQRVTGVNEFPNYLEKDVIDKRLNVYSNGEFFYKINGKYAKVSVTWNYAAPKGTGDTHYSIMRGTKAQLIIRQGIEENYKPVLYIESHLGEEFEKSLNLAIENRISKQFSGTSIERVEDGKWRVNIPERFKIGHEAHFAQVTENYLKYLESRELPSWEVPNMIAKYYTTIAAYKKAKEN